MRILAIALISSIVSCNQSDEVDEVSFVTGSSNVLCAVRPSGRMVCRGRLAECVGDTCRGRLVFDAPAEREVSVPGRVAEVVASNTHACARTEQGELWCWGGGAAVSVDNPDRPHRLATRARVIEAGVSASSTCVRYDDGTVDCWGANDMGQLGDDSTTSRRDPRPPIGLPLASSLSVEGDHACIVSVDGDVWCWGRNHGGQAVPGAARVLTRPTKVAGIAGATQVSIGVVTSCALVDGAVVCWGSTLWALDGTGVERDGTFGPTRIPLPGRARKILNEYTRTVVILEDSRLFGWGGNYYGDLGTGLRDQVLPPTQFTAYTPGSVALSDNGGCFAKDGMVHCWGFDHGGALTGRTPLQSDFEDDGNGSRKDAAVRWVPMNVPW